MNIATALTLRRGRGRLHWTDLASYAYLLLGVVLMFGPVLWLVLSSFKTPSALLEFPPSLLPFHWPSIGLGAWANAGVAASSTQSSSLFIVFRTAARCRPA